MQDTTDKIADTADVPATGVLDTRRLRSAGTLSRDEFAQCKAQSIALAYDPVQIGWVFADCLDDFATPDIAAPDAVPRAEAAPFTPRSLAPTYRFRAWTEADLPVYRSLLDDPAVWAMMYESYPNPLDEDLALELIRLSCASDHHEVRAVSRDGQIVGQVRMLFQSGAAADSAEFSYWFGRAHWGKGIGTAIVAVHTGQTFVRHPALTSIFAMAHRDNAASRRVLEKAGYQAGGTDPRRPDWIRYQQTRTRAEAFNSGVGLP